MTDPVRAGGQAAGPRPQRERRRERERDRERDGDRVDTGRRVALSAVAGGACVLAALSAWALTPRKFWSDEQIRLSYEQIVPLRFGDWVAMERTAGLIVNPQVEAALSGLYDQVVERMYLHGPTRRRLMVSLAYGSNQSRASEVHKPEFCYPAQGFRIERSMRAEIALPGQRMPVMRMDTRRGDREEPLTYWIRSGDTVVAGSAEQRATRIRMGLRGYIPDGLIFRVSEVASEPAGAWEFQARFVRDLHDALSPAGRRAIFATEGSAASSPAAGAPPA